MSISKDDKTNIIKEFSKNEKDTGSTTIQIAVLSERIKNLTEHFKVHNKDNHSKRGLVALVNKRKKLLNYLSKKNKLEYQEIIKKLKIRG
jgi:ribosomal protein S15, bacterial/organelle